VRSRFEQVYIWLLRELNSLGITLDGRTLTAQALADVDRYLEPGDDELTSMFAALVAEGVKFVSDEDGARRFAGHPRLSRFGNLGEKT
jgi:hypothetical protein